LNTPFTVSNTPATGRRNAEIASDIAEQAANDIKRVCWLVAFYHSCVDDDAADVDDDAADADADADAAGEIAIATAREHANEAKQHAITARQRADPKNHTFTARQRADEINAEV
jgi:hypothetical protein